MYKWDGSNWNETKLTASDADTTDYFGRTVATSSDGNTIVSGAHYDDDNGTESGSIYIYKWNGSSWVETKLIASDGAPYDYFGNRVSISSDGNIIFTLASGDDDLGDNSGSVYIYRWVVDSWVESKLTASDGAAGDAFGIDVATSLDGNTIAAGAYKDDDNGTDSGSIYVYKWNGSSWNETKLTASDGAAGDWLGYGVAISPEGNAIVAGALKDDDNGTESGSIYFFKWDGSSWNETKLVASDGAAVDWFGFKVSISSNGETIVAGAVYDDDNGTDSGSAYIYRPLERQNSAFDI